MTFVLVACLIVAVIGGGGFAITRLGAAAVGDNVRDDAIERANDRLAAGSRELRDGEVATVVGVVRSDEPLTAPLSGRACVGYAARLHVDMPGRPNHPIEDAKQRSFALEVDGATYAVTTTAMEIALPLEPVIPNDRWRNERFAKRRADARILKVNSAYEAVVEVGARVAVSATVLHERAAKAGEAGYRDEATAIRLIDPVTVGRP